MHTWLRTLRRLLRLDPPLCGARYDATTPPCIKNRGHENGPVTDWKRYFHSNGHWKWQTNDAHPIKIRYHGWWRS